MQAAFYEARGGARQVLRTGPRPRPEPGPGAVRVRVAFSGVNPSDVKARSAWRGHTALAWPAVVPHQDGSGVIDAVGEGVDPARIGQRVWLFMAQSGSPHGTAAGHTVLPAWRAVPLPAGTPFDHAAMLGVPAMTAHYALFDDEPLAGRTVLVHGGAGAVGFYAVQMARLGGAERVIATVSRAEQADEARRAGADAVVHRHDEDVIAAVRAACGGAAQPVQRIVDVAFGTNQRTNLALLAPGGRIAAYGSDAEPEPTFAFWEHVARDATLRTLLIYLAPRPRLERIAAEIGAWLASGALVHPRPIVHPLHEVAGAHERVEAGGFVGKVLIDLQDPVYGHPYAGANDDPNGDPEPTR